MPLFSPGTLRPQISKSQSPYGVSNSTDPSASQAAVAAAARRRQPSYGVSNTTDPSASQAAVKAAAKRRQAIAAANFDPLEWLNQFGSSGSSGGSYSGGSYSGTTSATSAAAKKAIAIQEESAKELEEMRKEQLAAAIDALTAEFDLQEGQLGAERDTFQGIFDKAKTEIGQTRERASEETYDSAVDRGILRSGVLKQDLVRTDQPYVDLLAQNVAKYNPEEGALGSEYRRIESALKLLAQQEEAQQREIELDSEREQMEFDKQLALIIAGMGG